MRTSNADIDNALAKTHLHATARLTAYNSRAYFSATTGSTSPNIGHSVGDTDFRMVESSYYHPELDKKITVVVHNGLLKLMVEGSTTVITPTYDGNTLPADGKCRPTISNTDILYNDGTQWVWIVYDQALVNAGTTACITDYWETPLTQKGAMYQPYGGRCLIYIDEGGIRVSFYDNTGAIHTSVGAEHKSPGRLFNPTQVYLSYKLDENGDPTSETSDDVYKTDRSGTTWFDSCLFAYITHWDGSVQVIRYKFDSDGQNGVWSEFKTAIPSDLSTFKVCNVINNGTRIFICGKFNRSEEYTTPSIYTLVSWSDDGFTFSLDRLTLCSLIDLDFNIHASATHLLFSCTNRMARVAAPYQVIGENAVNTVVELISLSGEISSGINATVKAGNEAYYTDTNIAEGYFAKLEIGVETVNGTEWIKYHDCTINAVRKSWEDGVRRMDVSLMPAGLWKTAAMTHPFYMEWQSKQQYFDPARELNNLYPASQDMGIMWSLCQDFFSTDNPNGWTWLSHEAATTSDHWCPDLDTLCVDYPVFGAAANYEIRLYGWSRAGHIGTAPTPDPTDDTPTNTNNDVFRALILVEDESGVQSTIISDVGELDEYDYPPQYWFTQNQREGSYPIIYSIANPGEGYKIIKLGIRVISDNGTTTYYLERVEMPDIYAEYIVIGPEAGGFEIDNTMDPWPLVDTISLQVTTGNATDGDKTVGTFNTRVGYVYGVVVVGDASFERGGVEYIQDAAFVASADPTTPPTWVRSFPPGTGPVIHSCVQVTAGTNPYVGDSVQIWSDNIPDGFLPSSKNEYVLHYDDSLDLRDSTIDATHIPYVFGNGSPMEIALFLESTGTITNIERGAFTVYIFECPVPYADFRGYGYAIGGNSRFYFTSSAMKRYTPEGQFAWEVHWQDLDSQYQPILFTYDIDHSEAEIGSSGDFYEIYLYNNQEGVPSTFTCSITSTFDNPVHSYKIGLLRNGAYISDIDMVDYAGGTRIFNFNIGTNEMLVVRIFANDEEHANTWRMQLHIEAHQYSDGQVPIPPYFNYIIPNNAIAGDDAINIKLKNVKKGIAQILLSTTPYSCWNFDTKARYEIHGPYTSAGCVGLAEDKHNFVIGYIRLGYIGIAMVRDSVKTVLAEQAQANLVENVVYDIRFWHRDGLFGIEYKEVTEPWPTRGSQLTYEWEEVDGEMAHNADLMHLGVYSFIDPPKFRTTGFRSSGLNIPVMPCDIDPDDGYTSNFITLFGDTGVVDVDGYKYNYTGRNHFFDDTYLICGPYQLRSILDWNGYDTDRDDSYHYPGIKAIEFSNFAWLDSQSHHDDYLNAIIAISTGYSWLNDETFFKPWITTNGQVVFQRHRGRYYAMNNVVPAETDGSTMDKVYITNALTGISAVEILTDEIVHAHGTFVYIDSDDAVYLHGFMGAGGDPDLSIENLLDKICRIAGTEASFPGDTVVATHTFADNGTLTL
jgi:hypothetical protein